MWECESEGVGVCGGVRVVRLDVFLSRNRSEKTSQGPVRAISTAKFQHVYVYLRKVDKSPINIWHRGTYTMY